MKPPLIVWTAPALGGKTRRCIEMCLQEGEEVRLVLPSDLQAQMARAILLAEGMPETIASRTVQGFRAFAFEMAGAERMRTLPPHLRRWLLQEAVRITAQSQGLLERAVGREGILTLLSSWVCELAREGVTPDALDHLAQHRGQDERLTSLGQLWRHYRQLLAAGGWHEEEDVYAIAAQALRDRGASMHLPRRVLLDGFARFSHGEMQLLRALAESSCEVIVTLCWDGDRGGLFETTSATLRRLEAVFEVKHERLNDKHPTGVSPTFERIAARLFGASTEERSASDTPAVEVWEAPHLLAEVEMIAREVVRLHRDGMAWGEIAVLCRDLPSVLPTVQGVFRQFGVPTQSFEVHSLAEHPQVRTLIGFMRLHTQDYPRDAVVGWLKSGYLQLDLLEADRMRLLAVRRGIRAGASAWLRLADELQRSESPAAPLLRGLIEYTQNLSEAVSPRDWFHTLQQALRALGFANTSAETETDEVLAQAMEVAEQVVLLLEREGGGGVERWSEAVVQAWSLTPQRRLTSPRNAVWLLEAARIRPLQPRVTFVMGLQEGRFPRRPTEDAFLRDEERNWLNEHMGYHLSRTADAAALERLAFYQAATSAKSRLVLTYSRTEGDRDIQPSFYLRSLSDLFPAGSIVQRSLRLSDVTVPLPEALDEDDAERSLVDALFDRNPHTRRPMDTDEQRRLSETLLLWLQQAPGRCARWWRWRYLPSLPRLGSQYPAVGARAYSATELEDLHLCAFRHFVRWELKLRPERDHYTAGQGKWLHAALHRRHRNPERPLEAVLSEVVQEQPVDRPLGEWHLLVQQVEDMLYSVAEREANLYSVFGLKTLWTEAAFGPAEEEEEEPGEQHAKPLSLLLPNGKRIRICGRLDRVDVFPENGAAVLVDYKRHLSERWWQQVQSGEDFQTVLYVAALRQVWKLTPAAVALDSALDGKRCRILFADCCSADLLKRLHRQPQEATGVVMPVHGERWKSIERTAAKKIAELLDRLLNGDILPTPGDHCQVCEYAGLCRVVNTTTGPAHDGEPYPHDDL